MAGVQVLPAINQASADSPKRGPGADGKMSEARAKFIRLFARTGLAVTAAEQAGYSNPDSAAYRLRRDPKVIKAVLEARQAAIESDLGGMAYAELLHLITDRERTPPSVRFAACRWVLETAGHGGQAMTPDGGKALADMSLAELSAFIKQGDAVLAGLQQQTIQGTAQRVNSTTEQQTDWVQRAEVADLLD